MRGKERNFIPLSAARALFPGADSACIHAESRLKYSVQARRRSERKAALKSIRNNHFLKNRKLFLRRLIPAAVVLAAGLTWSIQAALEGTGTGSLTGEAAAAAEIVQETDASEEGGTAAESISEISVSEPIPETSAEESPALFLYVCGEVVSPDTYELPDGSRIADAVRAAGGFTENASREALNLAEPVSDGEMIRVPSKQEIESGIVSLPTASAAHADPNASGGETAAVNINTADSAALSTLPGIGEKKAEKIIEYREEHGGFGAPEEIMNVPGIKEKAFARMKDRIRVD